MFIISDWRGSAYFLLSFINNQCYNTNQRSNDMLKYVGSIAPKKEISFIDEGMKRYNYFVLEIEDKGFLLQKENFECKNVTLNI